MAQTNYTPISLYYSTTASAVPTNTNLVNGELAINITDGKLYYKNNSGVVTLLASTSGSLGNVVGPASATDTAVALFDGTTGKLIKNSVVTIGSTGNTIISGTDNTNAMLRITQLGTGNALLVEDSANPDATPFVIDANGKVVSGNTTAYIATSGLIPQIASVGNTNGTASMGIGRFSADVSQGFYVFTKSRSATLGTLGSIVSSGDAIGTLLWTADDGTAAIQAASITAAVDGTPGTNDMPGRLVFSTTADGASTPTERMRINNAGEVGVGAASVTGYSLYVAKAITGGTNAFGIASQGQIQSDVTNSSSYFRSSASTAATAFTITSLYHYVANQGTFGASSAVTSQYGFIANSTITGATNNYGFYGDIASGTGRWNFYAGGTASNYFGGNTVVEVTDNTNAALRVTQLGTGNALLVEDSANPDSTPFVIDTAGRVLTGITSAQAIFGGYNPQIQVWGIGPATSSQSFASFNTAGAGNGSRMWLARSRGSFTAGVPTYGLVSNNDTLGDIQFAGDDGTVSGNFVTAAQILAQVDGPPGANDMPGRLIFSTTADGGSSSTERMRIDSSGRIVVGGTTAVATVTGGGSATTPILQIAADSQANSSIGAFNWSNAASGAYLNFSKSKSGTTGTYLAVTANDDLGSIVFAGASDTTQFSTAAYILGEVDSTVSSGSVSGRLSFATTAVGGTSPTERMRIDSAGNVGIGTSSPVAHLEVAGSTTEAWTSTSSSISGTTLTVGGTITGTVAVGDLVLGTNVQPYTRITALGTGTGGAGTYTVSVSQTSAAAATYGTTQYANTLIRVTNTDTSERAGQPTGGLQFYTSDTSSPTAGVGAYVAAVSESLTPDTALVFGTRDNAGGGIDANERMRIDSSGNVLVGTTTNTAGNRFVSVGGGIQLSGGTTAQAGLRFQYASSVATITGINNDNNAYNPIAFYTGASEAMRIDSSGNVGIGVTPATTGALEIKAGTVSVAPVKLNSGTNLTTAVAGAIEYDGTNFHGTVNATSGRGYIPSVQYFKQPADGSAIGTSASYFFTSSGTAPTLALPNNKFYEFEAFMIFTKATAGTVSFYMLTFNAAPQLIVSVMQYGAAAGSLTTGAANQTGYNGTSTNALLGTTISLNTGTTQIVQIKGVYWVQNTTPPSESVAIRALCSAGTMTPLKGSYIKFTEVPYDYVGNFTFI